MGALIFRDRRMKFQFQISPHTPPNLNTGKLGRKKKKKSTSHLALVNCGTHDHLLAGCTPFVDALVRANVADAVRIDLEQGVIAQL